MDQCRNPGGEDEANVVVFTLHELLYWHITCGVAMHTTNLRKVGGSVMLAVPPALLDLLKIGTGARVDMDVKNGRLVIEPRRRPSYTLDELLAQCQEDYVLSAEDRDWLQSNPIGKEII